MNPLFLRYFPVLAIAFAASTAMKVNAAPLSDEDSRQIQGVIASQIAAFAQDDADRAFDVATPQLRGAMGGSAGRFMALVRGAYPMVYRPASVRFQKSQADDDTVLQLVEITDAQSKSWIALFSMERQPDASWRIGACIVKENRWKSA